MLRVEKAYERRCRRIEFPWCELRLIEAFPPFLSLASTGGLSCADMTCVSVKCVPAYQLSTAQGSEPTDYFILRLCPIKGRT